MKKILLIVIAIVVAVVIFMPKYVGSQFASGLHNTVNTINAKTAYSLTIDELNSDWSSTQAVLTLGIDMSALSEITPDMPELSVKLNLNATHGPILTSGNGLIGLFHMVIASEHSELPEGFVLADQESPIIKLDSTTGLFGSTDFTNDIIGFTFTDPDSGIVAAFSGMQSQGTMASNGYKFTGKAESFSAKNNEIELASINNISLDGTADIGMMEMMEQGLYNSESTIRVANITFVNMHDGSQSKVNDTKILVMTTLDDATELGDVIVKTTVAEFDSPDMNLSDLIANIEIKNLQAKFMRAYQEFSAKSMDYMADPSAMETALNTFLQEHLLEQLQQNPEYNISELSGIVNGGTFKGEILTKLVNVSVLPISMEDPAFWMQHANINTQMTMQKAAAEFFAQQFVFTQVASNPQFLSMSEEEQEQMLMEQATATLSALVQQGMLVAEGEDYKVSFSLKDAAAELNGNPIPL